MVLVGRLRPRQAAGGALAHVRVYGAAPGGNVGATLRTYRLRQPVRFANHVFPVLLIVWILGLTGILIVEIEAVRGDPGEADWLAIPFFLAAITILGTVTWLWTRTALEVRVHDDRVEIIDMLRRSHAVRLGDRLELREQMFIPQPGTTRLRMTDRTLYLGPLHDKYELIEHLRRLAQGSGP
jgi:hypothetical protein